jgi:L-ascorbate metabolism protein UlaG (beta-lactamase superfamily)
MFHGKMQITYYGHSCFLLEIAGSKLLFDPFIKGNELANGIDVNDIKADYILVSHAHEDHTGDLVFFAGKTGAKVIGSWEVTCWLEKKGITNVHPMNIGGKREFEFGELTMVYAAHSSSFADGTYGGDASGFVVNDGEKTVYYSGDTGLNLEMKLIGERFTIDLALLPIGGNFTMDAKDAAFAANEFLNCKRVVGLHYDTFGYIVVDKKKAIEEFEDKGISLELIKIGDQITI